MPGLIGVVVGLLAVVALLFLSKRFMRKANPVEWEPVCAPYEESPEVRKDRDLLKEALVMDERRRILAKKEDQIRSDVAHAMGEYESGKRIHVHGACIVCGEMAFPGGPAGDRWIDMFCGVHVIEGLKYVDYFKVRSKQKAEQATA